MTPKMRDLGRGARFELDRYFGSGFWILTLNSHDLIRRVKDTRLAQKKHPDFRVLDLGQERISLYLLEIGQVWGGVLITERNLSPAQRMWVDIPLLCVYAWSILPSVISNQLIRALAYEKSAGHPTSFFFECFFASSWIHFFFFGQRLD